MLRQRENCQKYLKSVRRKLGSAKVQNSNPVRYNETELGKNNPVVKVNISAEGLRALHGSKLSGSVDIKAEQEQMHIFCSKALANALNIKKNELQKMPVDAQINELYAWYGHITKLNGKNTIILMNKYSL